MGKLNAILLGTGLTAAAALGLAESAGVNFSEWGPYISPVAQGCAGVGHGISEFLAGTWNMAAHYTDAYTGWNLTGGSGKATPELALYAGAVGTPFLAAMGITKANKDRREQ